MCGLWLIYYLNINVVCNVLGHLTRTVKSIEHTNLVCFSNVFSYKAYERVFKYFFLKKKEREKNGIMNVLLVIPNGRKNVAYTRQQTPYSVNQNSYVHIDRSDVSIFG